MSALAVIDPLAVQTEELLTAGEWSRVLGHADSRAFRLRNVEPSGTRSVRGQLSNVYSLASLPPDYKALAAEAKQRQAVHTFRDLLDVQRVETRHAPTPTGKAFAEYPPTAQARALKRREVMTAYYDAREAGRMESVCNALAQAKWREVFGPGAEQKSDRSVCFKKIQRLKTLIDKSGGPLAPKEAYLDSKSCPHPNATRELPEELRKDFVGRMTDSRTGVPSVAAVYRDYESAWNAGREVAGLGCRCGEEQFPITLNQLHAIAPGRAVRELAGRGKFAAKTKGLLAALPLDWSNVEPMRIVMFDDKTLDVQVLTDDGLKSFRPVIYIAYCAGTGRVLSFIAREEGRMTQLDVEGLQAAVLREHGFGGVEAGWPTRWIKERGTVSISLPRAEFLEAMFPGRLQICRTSMVQGRSAPGDWSQAGKGNFFGKGRIEAFMWTLDNLSHTLPGQTGNNWGQQPAMLGDTTLTLQKVINAAKNPKNRPSRSLLEESILTAAMSRALVWMDGGENVTAYEAAQATGVRPPMLYWSEFVALLGELFRAHNNRRGHRMQGFSEIRVPHPNNGGMMLVSESPNDKAARMLEAMELQGRKLMRPSEADVALMMHKVRRVMVTANGAKADDIRYFHPHSRAQQEAAAILGGAKTYLALYNPVQPDALYLLANPPSHLAAGTTQIPNGFRPQLFEVLPRYIAPCPTDAEATQARRESVAAFNGKLSRAVAVAMEPQLLAQHEARVDLRDRLEPLRTTIRSAQAQIAPGELPESGFATDMANAEHVIIPMSRAEQQLSAADEYARLLAADKTVE